MSGLVEQRIECPYCGETIDVLIDGSVPEQSYIEDCQVCCRPINFAVVIASEHDGEGEREGQGEGEIRVRVSTDQD